jgi:gas vesicle protein
MSNENNAGSVAIALFAGIAIGVVLGIMFAPKSGEETRKDISEKIDDVKKKVEDVETKGKDFLGKLGEKS